MAIRRIGQIFVDMGFISDEQLEMLLEEQQQRPGTLLGKIALELNMLSEEQVIQALAEQMGMQVVELGDTVIPHEVINLMTESMAQLYRAVPIHFEGNRLTVATCDPQNITIQDELRSLLGHEVKVVIAGETDVKKTLERYYDAEKETVDRIIDEIEDDPDLKKKMEAAESGKPLELADVEALADSAPVRKLLNMVLLLAIKDHASDIHFEPFEDEFRIRIKADGVLFEMVPPPRHLAFAITTRIKVMANLDFAEPRLPQDGRIELTVGGHPVDLRVSVLPTMFGESVVMRVLDRSVVSLDLAKVGMDQPTLKGFREVMHKPNGIVLVTGPTGSGKTTTLYSALNELNSVEDKLITTEDPVEYDMDGIIQVPIDADIGNTFAACPPASVGQDPDVIRVGEIRGLETAQIAVQAALTGHMVFSTLHTNDAPSTVTRMRDMGLEPFLITATVECILAQRLVRKICTDCRTEFEPSAEMLMELNMRPEDAKGKFYYGRGCDRCHNTGHKGRMGLYELMVMDDDLRDLISQGASTERLRASCRKKGMLDLRESGMRALYRGLTTIEEVVRETVLEDEG